MEPNRFLASLSHPDLVCVLTLIDRAVRVRTESEFLMLLSALAQVVPVARVAAVTGELAANTQTQRVLKVVHHGPNGWMDDYRSRVGPAQARVVAQRLLSCNGVRVVSSARRDAYAGDELPLCEDVDGVVIGRTESSLSLRSVLVFSGPDIAAERAFVALLEMLAPHFHAALVRLTLNSISEQLSRRELEVLRWVGIGKTSRETARLLDISERTVVFHMQNAMKKLGASSRSQAVAQAVTRGLIRFDTIN